MLPNNPNILSERKVSNTSMVSTSLNGPANRPISTARNNDINSNITKREWANGTKNELNKLNEIYYNKKVELDDVKKEYKKVNENYYKKLENLKKNKEKYEILKQENNNLKLMIMNIMKIKNETKGK